MKVIAVLNQKGGSGKTTIATHLSRALQLGGKSVVLIDSDRQGSARDWSAANPNQPVFVVAIDRPVLDRDIPAQYGKSDFVVIDGAPAADDMAVSAIRAAHLVLMPVTPSPYDVWAVSDLAEMVRHRIEITADRKGGPLKAAFVISRAIRGTTLGAEVTDALAEYRLPVLASRIHQRQAYPASAKSGSTVLDDVPGSAAAAEVLALRDDVVAFIQNPVFKETQQ